MSVSFEIRASESTYQVTIARGQLQKILTAIPDNALFICDARLLQQAGLDPARTIAIEATEQAKDLANLSPIMAQCKQLGTNRKTHLYAIGGGVIQDIACFVASTYMRGLTWSYFPTTLLGMVDSCIGGKSSINAGGYKNLVGTIHPPQAVYIDPLLTDSLSLEQKVAGLAEAVKICFAHEGDAFERYLKLAPTAAADDARLEQTITLSLSTKKWFIEIDEFDQNERQLLNFGHTFGHAIEAATDYAVSHGVAVAIGMLCVLRYTQALGYSTKGHQRVDQLAAYIHALLAQVPDLKRTMATLDPSRATEKFTADKKHDAKNYWIVAPNAKGYLQRTPLPKTDASLTTIQQLFQTAKDGYDIR